MKSFYIKYIKSVTVYFFHFGCESDIPLPKAENGNLPKPNFRSTRFISDINVSIVLLDHLKSNIKKLFLELS